MSRNWTVCRCSALRLAWWDVSIQYNNTMQHSNNKMTQIHEPAVIRDIVPGHNNSQLGEVKYDLA